MIKLYQFPLSHYCEIARWALDYKGVEYQKVDLVPGGHVKLIRGLAKRSSVPVIQSGDSVVQGSGEIITWLDEQYPQQKLTPVPSAEKQTALEWEKYLDGSVGVPLRLYLYHHLLDRPKLLIPILTQGKGPLARLKLRLMYPMLRKKMRQFMRINDETAVQARKTVLGALARIEQAHEKGRFLVGGAFSRADLVAAALWAPLIKEPKYGLTWPAQMPAEIAELQAECVPRLQWVSEFYRDFR